MDDGSGFKNCLQNKRKPVRQQSGAQGEDPIVKNIRLGMLGAQVRWLNVGFQHNQQDNR